jgi:hypothetical protein
MNGDVPLLSLGPGAEGVSYASVLHGVSFGLKRKFKMRETMEFNIGYLQFDAPILSGVITD